MKNVECAISIRFQRGWVRKYRKGEEDWSQTSSKGTVRSFSAEQLLFHILPQLAGRGLFTVTVEANEGIHV